VLPVLIRLDSFVEIFAPSDRLVDNLLDAKTPHLVLVLKDVVKDRLAHAIEVVFVDLIQHRVDKVLNTFLVDSVKVTRDQLNDMGKPVLADGSNHIDLNLVLNVLTVTMEGDLAGTDVLVTQNLFAHDSIVLLLLISRTDVVVAHDLELGTTVVDVLITYGAGINIDVETFARRCEVSSNAV